MIIGLIGDIALLGKYNSKNTGIFNYLSPLKTVLSKCDYVIGNLETPLTNKNKTLICKSMHLRSSIDNCELLKYLGINIVTIANNHIFDFGKKGLIDTIQTLECNNIQWVGYKNKYLSISEGETTINVSGFCCVSTNGVGLGKKRINVLRKDSISRQLSIDKKEGAYSLLMLHWGEEHTHYPSQSEITIGRAIARTKSNVFICGSHPHVIQGMELFENNHIYYSLGNFLFDDCYSINKSYLMKQTDDNRRILVVIIEICNNAIINCESHFFFDNGISIMPYDGKQDLSYYSEMISKYREKEYFHKRQIEIETTLEKKFGKHDVRWLVSRLNYYSIVSKIMAINNKRKYLKYYRDFCNE